MHIVYTSLHYSSECACMFCAKVREIQAEGWRERERATFTVISIQHVFDFITIRLSDLIVYALVAHFLFPTVNNNFNH